MTWKTGQTGLLVHCDMEDRADRTVGTHRDMEDRTVGTHCDMKDRTDWTVTYLMQATKEDRTDWCRQGDSGTVQHSVTDHKCSTLWQRKTGETGLFQCSNDRLDCPVFNDRL